VEETLDGWTIPEVCHDTSTIIHIGRRQFRIEDIYAECEIYYRWLKSVAGLETDGPLADERNTE
jgi:hypothetical protein